MFYCFVYSSLNIDYFSLLHLQQRIAELEMSCDRLATRNRDVISEREVYRFELANYKEAVLALRASGCVPPRVAVIPRLPGWGQADPSLSSTITAGVDGDRAGDFYELDQAIHDFVSYVEKDSHLRLSSKMQALRHVKSAVTSIWPRAQVKVFGSFVTGMQVMEGGSFVVLYFCCNSRIQSHLSPPLFQPFSSFPFSATAPFL